MMGFNKQTASFVFSETIKPIINNNLGSFLVPEKQWEKSVFIGD